MSQSWPTRRVLNADFHEAQLPHTAALSDTAFVGAARGWCEGVSHRCGPCTCTSR